MIAAAAAGGRGGGAGAEGSPSSSCILSNWTARKIPSPHAAQQQPANPVPDMTLSVSNRGSFATSSETIGDSPSPPRGSSRPLDSEAADGQAGPKRRRSLASSEPPATDGGPAPVAVTFDLGTLEWKQYQGTCSVPKGCSLASALGVLIPQNDGDDSHVEAASNWGEQLLDSGGSGAEDSIDTRSELCDVEKTVTAAVQILHAMALMDHDADWDWAQNLPRGQQWCVGGSVLATYEARDKYGCAQSIVLVTCRETAGASSSSAGSQANLVTTTCERHCVIRLEDVMVDGQWWQTLQLKKCTWACCERSRPFASPPEIPWETRADPENGSCYSCAQQSSLDEREDQTSPLVAEDATHSAVSGDSAEDATAAAATRAMQHSRNSPPVRPSMPPKNC